MLRTTGIVLLLAFIVGALGCGGASSRANSPGGSNSSLGGSSGDPNDATVSISPASETLRTGGQRQFSGFDRTVGQYDVTWNVQEGAAGGTVTADGVYTAPNTTGTFHLVATSIANPSVSATAPVKVVNVGFVSIGNMAIARSGHTATLLVDGRVLIAGGTRGTAHSAEFFVPGSGSFTPSGGSMVQVRTGHCATLLQDGRVLIVGGGDSGGNLFKTAELFDPMTQSFTATGDLNQARTNATATLLQNGKVLIAGGQDSEGTVLSSAELYDPSTGTFIVSAKMHLARAQHTATLLSNGKVLLLGSISDTGNAELFDPAAGVFSGTGSLIQPRAHHTATLLPNGKVLVLGGTQVMPPVGGGAAAQPVSLNSAEVYDPAKGEFQTAGKLLVARDSHSATLLANGTVLVAGGYTHDFDGDAQPEWYTMVTAELFNPATSASTSAASLESDRAEHAATRLNNGEVLVTGGTAGFQELCCSPRPHSSSLASAEVYK
jgi:Galactose oxidase, central domain/Kelch motif